MCQILKREFLKCPGFDEMQREYEQGVRRFGKVSQDNHSLHYQELSQYPLRNYVQKV